MWSICVVSGRYYSILYFSCGGPNLDDVGNMNRPVVSLREDILVRSCDIMSLLLLESSDSQFKHLCEYIPFARSFTTASSCNAS